MLLSVPGFPAVGDPGQELTDVLDFLFTPEMQAGFASLDDLRSRHFPERHVTAQSSGGDSEFL